MNLRNVLRAYGLLRNLSDDESALLNILRALNDSDRAALMLSMSDKPQKKSGKKAAGKGGGKSKHASSLAEKVGGTLASIAKTAGGSDDNARKVIDTMDAGSSPRCQFTRYDGKLCLLLPDHNIHHLMTAREYHPFVSPVPDAADSLDQPTIETGTDSAGTAVSAGG